MLNTLKHYFGKIFRSRSRRPSRRAVSLALENLEDRALPSASVMNGALPIYAQVDYAQSQNFGSTVRPAQQLVIHSAAELAADLGRTSSQVAHALGVSSIDWKTEMVVVIDQGTVGLWALSPYATVTSVRVDGDHLTVHWQLDKPVPGPGIAVPFDILLNVDLGDLVLVKRFDGPVTFKQDAPLMVPYPVPPSTPFYYMPGEPCPYPGSPPFHEVPGSSTVTQVSGSSTVTPISATRANELEFLIVASPKQSGTSEAPIGFGAGSSNSTFGSTSVNAPVPMPGAVPYPPATLRVESGGGDSGSSDVPDQGASVSAPAADAVADSDRFDGTTWIVWGAVPKRKGPIDTGPYVAENRVWLTPSID